MFLISSASSKLPDIDQLHKSFFILFLVNYYYFSISLASTSQILHKKKKENKKGNIIFMTHIKNVIVMRTIL